MPVHDWTRVDAGIFHDFHNGWIIALRNSLNSGALPSGYYALSEQHAGKYIADVLSGMHAAILDPDFYINTPLEPTYETTWNGTPIVWRTLLEKPRVKTGKRRPR